MSWLNEMINWNKARETPKERERRKKYSQVIDDTRQWHKKKVRTRLSPDEMEEYLASSRRFNK